MKRNQTQSMHRYCGKYVFKDTVSKAKFHFHSWWLEEMKSIFFLSQTNIYILQIYCCTWACVLILPKLFFHHPLYLLYIKTCFIWHQSFIKLLSCIAHESHGKKLKRNGHEKKSEDHALLAQLQSTSSPSAAALPPHPRPAQAGLCLQLLAFSLHTQTTSRRTSHKSEHRLRSVAWVSEADSLVSELPDIHHKHNTAESLCLQLSWLSRGKDCFPLLVTMDGTCNQK